LKHAQASQVDIQFNYQQSQLNIIFEDNGKGFDSGKQVSGIGLRNIEARVKKLQGELQIDTALNRGSIFIIDIPLS
jgi:NarL family two-component system sensor histidine kinase LiaS